jgi:hypothetical protein
VNNDCPQDVPAGSRVQKRQETTEYGNRHSDL